MTDLVTFDFDGDAVQAVTVEGEPWFVGRDACLCLGIENNRDAVARLPPDDRQEINLNTVGTTDAPRPGNPNVIVINEPGLYRLIFESRKPQAERFKKWVFEVVLPSIRKTGAYGRPRLTAEETMGALALVREARHVYGTAAARRLWRDVGLPDPGPEEVFGQPSGLATIDERNRGLLASVHDFLSDCCEKDSNAQVQAIKLYEAYNRWASSTQTPLMTNTMFGRMMMQTGIKRFDGHTRLYVGLRLKADVLGKLDA